MSCREKDLLKQTLGPGAETEKSSVTEMEVTAKSKLNDDVLESTTVTHKVKGLHGGRLFSVLRTTILVEETPEFRAKRAAVDVNLDELFAHDSSGQTKKQCMSPSSPERADTGGNVFAP
jgi:hypothetical protein